MYEGCGGLQGGHRSDPLHPPSHVGQAAAPGGLRRPPPTMGSWTRTKNKHTTINQRAVACGSRRDLRGAMEVSPYGPGRNLVVAAAPVCLRLPPASPGSKKTQKIQKNNQQAE